MVNRDLVCDGRDVLVFNLWIVKVIEIIEDRDLMTKREELLDEMRPDKPGATGHENSHDGRVGASNARQKYQAATDRYGRQRSPIASSSFGLGSTFLRKVLA